mmetsp:Transcript_79770/g.208016  ORF Transcript_79770/g.208016 Transcript_79770/m.208016 type:complete len:387 (-) Transcript_79770:143-1303(-)
MKLKKFYLRYDPPGVGIEVQHQDGNADTTHKDLPNSAESVKEIEALVDDIIASQPGLLTQRRHQRALVQLLGRLYNVDVGPDVEDSHQPSKDPDKRKTQRAESDPSGGWRVGQEVVLVGMEGRLQVHNGEVGKLAKVNAEKDKCEVHLSDEVLARESEDKGHIKVKGLKHILPVAATGGPLGAGTPVVICRLRNHAELNGWPGRILEKSQGRTEDQSRYVVRAAESGQLFRVKRDNLVQVEPDALSKVGMDEAFHMDFNEQMRSMKAKLDQTQSGFGAAAVKKPNTKNPEEKGLVTLPEVPGAATGATGSLPVGARVHLTGLRVATAFNGASAVILTVDRAKALYQVRLDDGSSKTVKAENVRSGPGPGTGSGKATKSSRSADVMK